MLLQVVCSKASAIKTIKAEMLVPNSKWTLKLVNYFCFSVLVMYYSPLTIMHNPAYVTMPAKRKVTCQIFLSNLKRTLGIVCRVSAPFQMHI